MKSRLMKLIFGSMVSVFLVLCTGCNASIPDTGEITVINYGEYMDPAVIKMFTEETGIKVNYEEALTPEELYTKYKSGAIDYDLICTSDYMIQKLIAEDELKKISIDSLEYESNIGDRYWQFAQMFDPNREYAIPYFWGTVGILYDKTKVDKPIDSWDVLFNGEYKGEIIMQNSMRDAFMVALKELGYSINTSDKEEITQARDLLLAQKKDVQAYLVDEARDEVVAGNATMAVVYSGEAYLGKEYNENLKYVVPKEGSNVWLDCFAVTKKCKDTTAAMQFLDFICREDVARKNFEFIYYSTPNEAVIESMSEEEKDDETLVPPLSATENCEVLTQIDESVTKMISDMWMEIKSE